MGKLLNFPGAEPIVIIDPAFKHPFAVSELGFTVRVERPRRNMLNLVATWHPNFQEAEHLAKLICALHNASLEDRTIHDDRESIEPRAAESSTTPPEGAA